MEDSDTDFVACPFTQTQLRTKRQLGLVFLTLVFSKGHQTRAAFTRVMTRVRRVRTRVRIEIFSAPGQFSGVHPGQIWGTRVTIGCTRVSRVYPSQSEIIISVIF